MSTRSTVVFTLVLIGAAIALSAAVYPQLPQPMASHWGVNDQVNGTMPRAWGAFLMPAITLFMLALFLILPAIDPMRANIATFRGTFNAFIALLVAFMLYLHVLVILWNLGVQSFRMSALLMPAMGLLLIWSGVLMRHAKRNYFIGVRTPWTLSSDRVWDQTHRLAAVLFIGSGALALFGALVPGPVAFVLVLVPVMVSSLVVIVYSYVLWRDEQAGGSQDKH